MGTIPKALYDLGLTAVALFLFVSAIYLIFRIIQTVKQNKTAESGNGNGNGKRVPCLQSPQLQAIMTTQARMMDAVAKMEQGGEDLGRNMALQTKLMEQFGRILDKLSDCMVRQEATAKARHRSEGQ
jgi:hypothetical protein